MRRAASLVFRTAIAVLVARVLLRTAKRILGGSRDSTVGFSGQNGSPDIWPPVVKADKRATDTGRAPEEASAS